MNNRGIIKLHYNCNNHCVFCHSDRHRGETDDPENIFRKIDRAPEYGINQILLSGGEPTIYPHLKKVLSYLKSKNLKSGLVSNGRMFSYEPFLRFCMDTGAEYFYVSLHAHKPELHDLITESEGSWAQAFQGIKNISKFSSATTELIVNCVVTGQNVDYLPDLIKLLADLPRVIIKFSFPELKGRALSHNSGLVADLRSVGTSISKAMQEAASRGVTCYYDGLPFCCIAKEFRMRFHNLEKSRIFYMSEVFEEGFFRTDESDRIHGEDCCRCSYYEICEGLYKGYTDQDIAPLEEPVPNYFSIYPVFSKAAPKDPCLLKMLPSQAKLPFKRIGVLREDVISLYEAEDSFFKRKNFQAAKKEGQLYAVDRKKGEWTGALTALRQLTILPECGVCPETDCPQIFSDSSGGRFTDVSTNILAKLGELSGNVLEVGFGDIFFKDILFGELKDKINYVGLEPEPGKHAKAVLDFPDNKFYQDSLESFSYERNFFDFILMAGSFNHIKNLGKGLKVCHDLLKDTGRLLVIENSIFGLLNGTSLAAAEQLNNRGGNGYEHYRNSSIETASILLEQGNFRTTCRTAPCSSRHNLWMIECQIQQEDLAPCVS